MTLSLGLEVNKDALFGSMKIGIKEAQKNCVAMDKRTCCSPNAALDSNACACIVKTTFLLCGRGRRQIFCQLP